MKDEQILLDKLLKLYSQYTAEYRSSIQPEKLRIIKESGVEAKFDSKLIRESLLEHVGHLPITAVAIYPFVKDSAVNLGDALIMLSIHDIAELETGDIAIFIKTDEDKNKEQDIAFNMIEENLQDFYKDMEDQRTSSGKFAKSIDKIVADILDLLVPKEISIERYKSMGVSKDEIVSKKREKKMQYMTWNPFLKSFYENLLDNVDRYFNN